MGMWAGFTVRDRVRVRVRAWVRVRVRVRARARVRARGRARVRRVHLDHDVLRLQVAEDDAEPVDVQQRQHDLARIDLHPVLGQLLLDL